MSTVRNISLLDDWSDLETFEERGSRIGDAFVTIGKSKYLSLSTGFVHKVSEAGPINYTILSYSKAKQAIVFEFTNDKTQKGAIKLTGSAANKNISAKPFFAKFYINTDRIAGKRYPPHKIEVPGKSNCWAIFLEEGNES